MKLLILLGLVPACFGFLCPTHQYWSSELESCIGCTKCKSNQITVRPCQSHLNTECKLISSLSNFDLPWEPKSHRKTTTVHFKKASDNNDDDIYKDIFGKHLEDMKIPKNRKHEHQNHKNKKYPKQRNNDKFLTFGEGYKEKKHKKHFEFPSDKHHHKGGKHHFLFKNDDEYLSKEKPLKSHYSLKVKSYKKNIHLDQLEDEDMLKQWLVQSKKQLKLKKDNLLKTLKEESDENDNSDEEKKIKLSYPLHEKDAQLRNLNRHASLHLATPKKTDLDDEKLKELIKGDEPEEVDLSTIMSNKREPFGFRSASPSNRLVLGEPSTISEIIDQIKYPEKENLYYEKSKFQVIPVPDKETDDVISVPFTAAERLVWDWQAVALCAAVVTCLVFFLVVATYSILNARQWKRVKRNYNTEIEEMSTRIALMRPTIDGAVPDCHFTSNVSELLPIKVHKQKH